MQPLIILPPLLQKSNTIDCATSLAKKPQKEVVVSTEYTPPCFPSAHLANFPFFSQAHHAYTNGDSASAHQLSEEGKKHASQMDAYNKQASDFIFRENNAEGRIPADTIDLHGQFVEEAEEILEKRIRFAQQTGQTHLHVIVGKGNHSKDHVQKIKPKVEEICRELGLKFRSEENEGRMYINLQGGEAVPPEGSYGDGYQQPSHGGYQQPQGGYQQPQGGYQGGQQQNNDNDNDELEKLAKKLLPRILKKLDGCCSVM